MAAIATSVSTAKNVARYFLALAAFDGDLVTNLKMQKLVYFAYGWVLAKTDRKLFDEPIEAWANGLVVRSLYDDLERYGSAPIDEAFLEMASEEDFDALAASFPEDVLETLNGVYEQYMRLSAFDLVTLAHSQRPWLEARGDREPTERCNAVIRDDHVLEQFSAA